MNLYLLCSIENTYAVSTAPQLPSDSLDQISDPPVLDCFRRGTAHLWGVKFDPLIQEARFQADKSQLQDSCLAVI